MEFAVVRFLEDSDEDAVSEVPVGWLDNNNTECWWPQSKNIGYLISKSVLPNKDTWKKYSIRVESFCSEYLKSSYIKTVLA